MILLGLGTRCVPDGHLQNICPRKHPLHHEMSSPQNVSSTITSGPQNVTHTQQKGGAEGLGGVRGMSGNREV